MGSHGCVSILINVPQWTENISIKRCSCAFLTNPKALCKLGCILNVAFQERKWHVYRQWFVYLRKQSVVDYRKLQVLQGSLPVAQLHGRFWCRRTGWKCKELQHRLQWRTDRLFLQYEISLGSSYFTLGFYGKWATGACWSQFLIGKYNRFLSNT